MAGPRDASTIVLLRCAADGGALETLLLRRHRSSGFMAGAFVFPGGKLDEEDYAESTLARAGDWSACPALNETPGTPLSKAKVAGLYVAACRETFEEAGALFARRRGEGALIRLDDHGERLGPWRKKLSGREVGIGEVLASEDLDLDLSRIHYFSHWITPSLERRRFDTRFFVAEVPAGQTPTHDDHETTEQRWVSATDALAQHRAREIFLPPPTQRTLEEIEGLSTFDAVAELAARRAARMAPIMPKATVIDGAFTILLPWDDDYDRTEGESLAAADPDPTAGRASRIVVKPLG